MATHELSRPDHPVDDDGACAPVHSLVFDAVTASVPAARAFVRRWLDHLERRHGPAAADVASDVELVTSELVTNAVEHGTGSSVALAVSCDGTAVELRVSSHGNVDGVGPADEWQVADVGSVTGRGLGIVRAIADRVAVHRRGDELRISVAHLLP